jgi:hypothetical protein
LDGLKNEKSKNYKIQQSFEDNRKTWEVIKENIFGSDNRHSIKEISKDGWTVTDPTDMANSFNKYFSEMAESISNALPSVSYEQHYNNQQDHHRLLYAAKKP